MKLINILSLMVFISCSYPYNISTAIKTKECKKLNDEFFYGIGYNTPSNSGILGVWRKSYMVHEQWYFEKYLPEPDSLSYNNKFILSKKDKYYYLIVVDKEILNYRTKSEEKFRKILKKNSVPDSLKFISKLPDWGCDQ